MNENWTELKIKVPAPQADIAGAIANMVVPYGIYMEDYSHLEEEALEIAHIDLIDEELLQKDREHAIIHIYISPEANPAEAVSFLEERFQAENIPYEIDRDSCVEEDWINNWKQYFSSFTVGNLYIKPTWEETEEIHRDKLMIEIDPGVSFGTGKHETTQLCLLQMQKYLKKGDLLLDVGCGSGILSIAALKMGAAHVTGTDIDPDCIGSTRENMETNRLDLSLGDFYVGNLTTDRDLQETVGRERYDVVVANILADIIIPMATAIPLPAPALLHSSHPAGAT